MYKSNLEFKIASSLSAAFAAFCLSVATYGLVFGEVGFVSMSAKWLIGG
jgi:hypothetical protein